jgi:hypothetical protein
MQTKVQFIEGPLHEKILEDSMEFVRLKLSTIIEDNTKI